MMRLSIRSLVAVGVLLACPVAASASVTTYGDKASFDAAVSTTHYDFEAYDDGYFQFAWDLTVGPATFNGLNSALFLMSPGFVDGYGTVIASAQYGDTALDIALGGGATAFGLSFASYRGGGLADVLVNGELVTTVDVPWAYDSKAFLGLISLDGITSIQINTRHHGNLRRARILDRRCRYRRVVADAGAGQLADDDRGFRRDRLRGT